MEEQGKPPLINVTNQPYIFPQYSANGNFSGFSFPSNSQVPWFPLVIPIPLMYMSLPQYPSFPLPFQLLFSTNGTPGSSANQASADANTGVKRDKLGSKSVSEPLKIPTTNATATKSCQTNFFDDILDENCEDCDGQDLCNDGKVRTDGCVGLFKSVQQNCQHQSCLTKMHDFN